MTPAALAVLNTLEDSETTSKPKAKTNHELAIQAALAIVNSVNANPALHFDCRNVTVLNMAAIIEKTYEAKK